MEVDYQYVIILVNRHFDRTACNSPYMHARPLSRCDL